MRQLLLWTWGLWTASGCTCSRSTEIEDAELAARLERLPKGQGGLVDAGTSRRFHAPQGPTRPLSEKHTKRTGKRCQLGPAQQVISALGSVVSDEEDFAPFGVEVGTPLLEAQGFWVPWLSSDGKTSSVGLNHLDKDLLTSRTIALGAVHWDGGPPRVVRIDAETVLAAVPDGDAHGGSYRVAVVGAGGVSWGAELDGSSDDSPAFDFAATAGRSVLVWDDYDREHGRGTIRGAKLGADGQLIKDLGKLAPETTDAEGPRLTRHDNGYWLAWLRVAWEPKVTAQPGPPHGTGVPEPEAAALKATQRWIEVVPLDADGNLAGVPLRVSPIDAMVQGFDLEAGHGGGLVLSWRQDFANAGTDGGEIWTAHLDPGGALELFPVEAPGVGGTLPVLLFDPKPPSGVPHGWLSVETRAGDSALAALSPFGTPLEPLTGNVGLGLASVLGALDGQLLLATPRRRDIVLRLARCAYSPFAHRTDAGVPR